MYKVNKKRHKMPFFVTYNIFYNILVRQVNSMQQIMPVIVGNIVASAVHFQLPVSFLIVSIVVEHGQCSMENIIVLMAVTHVQPF